MATQNLYKNHTRVYPEPAKGKFYKFRLLGITFTLLVFFCLPFLSFNNRQAIWFDLNSSKFYILNLTFFPQDFILIALLLIIIMISLFLVTAYSGRIWCGYICPQTIWIEIYNNCARLIEGDRNKRIKLDSSNIDILKIYKKIIKHILWITIAFATAFIFVSYFTSIKTLISIMINLEFKTWSFFWTIFFAISTYFNAGWMCEQFCSLICPYARLQSVMFDENTFIVSYDKARGEPRGSRKKTYIKENLKLGDCVDCKKCINCCPTGIDIRNGLQMECISCAACIDACNSVMKKMNYKPNLIKYTKENILTNDKDKKSIYRLLSYFFTLIIFLIIFLYILITRSLIEFSIIKNQAELYEITKNNKIENCYIIKITNKTQEKANYEISINNKDLIYIGYNKVSLSPSETVVLDIKLITKESKMNTIFTEVIFTVKCLNKKKYYVNKSIQFISKV
ncbi:MAG TPA: cytochrome c oxidase accessory protein CcoG [Candidatus Azoamicus sp. OHIO1]